MKKILIQLFCKHDYIASSESVPGITYTEAQYWRLEKCTKCTQFQAVLG